MLDFADVKKEKFFYVWIYSTHEIELEIEEVAMKYWYFYYYELVTEILHYYTQCIFKIKCVLGSFFAKR